MLNQLHRLSILIYTLKGYERRVPVSDIVNMNGDGFPETYQPSTHLMIFIKRAMKLIYPLNQTPMKLISQVMILRYMRN